MYRLLICEKLNMKRARTEQLQTTVLLYLKKRNFTDSETTFRHNIKFEEKLMETTTRTIDQNKTSSLDGVVAGVHCFSEYFLAFKSLRDFIVRTKKDGKYVGLDALLYPIFMHAYLDLILAGRLKEAEEFYSLYHDDDDLQQYNELLVQLQNIQNANDLTKYVTIAQMRKNFCEIDLSSKEKKILLRFLHGQDNLLLMKIINEHLRINNINGALIELEVTTDCSEKENKESPSKQRHTTVVNEDQVKTTEPTEIMIISPPSLSQPQNLSNVQSRTPEKTSYSSSLDLDTLQKRVRNVKESVPSLQNLRLYKYHDVTNNIVHATMSHDRRLVCTGREDSSINLWNIRHKPSDVEQTISIHGERNKFDDADNEIDEKYFPDLRKPIINVSQVNFGDDFKEDVLKRTILSSAKRKKDLHEKQVVLLRGHGGPVYSSCFSHDDKYLLSCSEDTTVRLWDMQDLCNKVVYKGHNLPVWCISMSAFSMYFATGSYDCTAKLWSLERAYPLRIYAGHQHSVESIGFHGNASYLATADHTVRLWDVNSGKTVRLMMGHWAPVTCLAFSPDGKWLASSGEDCRIRVWDISSGNLLKEIRGHTDTVYSVNFSPDGTMLTSSGADCSICVWNITNTLPTNMTGLAHPHLVADWKLKDDVNRLLSSKFVGDSLNCIGVV